MLAAWLIPNHFFQAVLIIVMGLWFFGWAGTLFLSSTRVIFAAAFDRVLPSWAASISAKRRVPFGSLALMVVPALVVSWLYAYRPSVQAFFFDATAVIAITYLGTVIAAIILPWRRKDLYENSPIARYKIGGVPMITLAGIVSAVFLIGMLYEWAHWSLYGSNSPDSAKYFGFTYVAAVVIYVVAFIVRRRQGIDLRRIHHEIPVE